MTSPLFTRLKQSHSPLLAMYQNHLGVFLQPFNFTSFLNTVPPGVQKPDQQFLEWFVGFSEGDGSFIVTGDRCFFTITQRDEPLLQLIQQTLGFGSIVTDRTYPGVFRYHVTALKDVFRLILLFNGNLVLKKTTKRFKPWVANYNRRRGTELLVLSRWDAVMEHEHHKHPTSTHGAYETASLRAQSVVWNSSWLAGFCDAEACFHINISQPDLDSLSFESKIRFILDQKGEVELLLHMLFLYGSGSFYRRDRSDALPEEGMYRVEGLKVETFKLIQDYVESHPLRGKKAQSYEKWRHCIQLIQDMKNDPKKYDWDFMGTQFKALQQLVQEINGDLESPRRTNIKQRPNHKLKRESRAR